MKKKVNYFPSRFDPVRHAAPHPVVSEALSGRRERAVIAKENNFSQPGERFRSWPRDRQERCVFFFFGALGVLACCRWVLTPCPLWCRFAALAHAPRWRPRCRMHTP